MLDGATASDAFLLSRAELDSAVLADPGIKLGRCDREQVAAGKVGSQALALLVFLSRSGLKPTVGELRCGSTERTAKGVVTTFPAPDTLYLTAINGVPIAGHQGAGTITDITIRTLLTLQHQVRTEANREPDEVSGGAQHRGRARLLRLHQDRAGQACLREEGEQERRRKDGTHGEHELDRPTACRPDLEHARVAAADDTAEHIADAKAIDQAERLGDPRQERRSRPKAGNGANRRGIDLA